MAQSHGAFSLKRQSSSYLSDWTLVWWEALLLLGGGALAVVLHNTLRIPLQLHGRHGVEWMALLVMGRASSRFRGAGTLTSLGAVATSLLPIWAARNDPTLWLTYLLPGLVMDACFALLPRWREKAWFLVGLGGLGHATKPLVRWVISLATGWPYGSLLYGVAYPLALHILFGLVGGLIGTVIVLGIKRFR